MRDILVIGGSRYFGKRLVAELIAGGDRVTVLNRGSAPAPAGAGHLVADRNDEAALERALAGRTYDAVVDQFLYTPRQAAVARRVFGSRTRRYVMTSTVEVYEYEDSATPVREDAVDPRTIPVDLELPWQEPEFAAAHYGEGKRQAEAVLAADPDPAFGYVAVRVAHVLGGTDDFTGRLAHYAERLRTGDPIRVPVDDRPATYIQVDEIARFLAWTTRQEFTGAVNAASHGQLTTATICAEIAAQLPGSTQQFQHVEVGDVSPLSFRRSYAMDNSRGTALGFPFGDTQQWLPGAVAETLTAVATATTQKG